MLSASLSKSFPPDRQTNKKTFTNIPEMDAEIASYFTPREASKLRLVGSQVKRNLDIFHPITVMSASLAHTFQDSAGILTYFSVDGPRIVTGVSHSGDEIFGKIAPRLDSAAKIFNSITGEIVRRLEGNNTLLRCLEITPDGRIVGLSGDCTVKIWREEDGSLIRSFRSSADIDSLALSPNGKKIVTGCSDYVVRIHDVDDDASVHTLEGHTNTIIFLEFTPDGKKIITVSCDQTVKIWDIETGTLIYTLNGHASLIMSLAIIPNGTQVITASYDGIVKIWNINTGLLIRSFSAHKDVVKCLEVTPDGNKIITTGGGISDYTVKAWDVATGNLIYTFDGHKGPVTSLIITPDSKKAITGSGDRTIKMWDLSTGRLRHTFRGHTAVINALEFSSNGNQIVSSSSDRTVRVWNFKEWTLGKSV